MGSEAKSGCLWCPGIPWDGADFLCGGLYGAVVWISDESSGDNRAVFWSLLSSAHRGKDFSASCASEGLGAQPRELNQRGAPFHVGRVRGKKGEDEGMSESFPGFQGTPQSSVCTCSPFYGWGD